MLINGKGCLGQDCLFIPCAPNDSGLAMGAGLYHHYVTNSNIREINIGYPSPYLGLNILDELDIDKYQDVTRHCRVCIQEVISLLRKGMIIGVMQGRAEVGPRALGNRTILADPSIPGTKDRINEKIKFREWYRPYAPIVRNIDFNDYFDIDIDIPYMSIIANVKQEWRDRLAAVTHVDGTARLQTVSKNDNKLMWDLLTEMKRQTGMGVLVNTSFNIKGRPIASTLREAFEALDQTELDAVYYNDHLYFKNK